MSNRCPRQTYAEWKRESDRVGDERFQTAMRTALALRRERAPYLGVDKRPGTDHPRFVNRNEQGVPMESILTGF